METKPTQEEWDNISFVSSSQYRKTVLGYLSSNGPATPSRIEAETALSISHVSRSLGKLRERELVELLVPDERRKGRFYGITEQGDHLLAVLREVDIGGPSNDDPARGGTDDD